MSFAQHIHKMSNSELIGLAKNRFIDEDTQLEIARHPYLRARQYLCENPSITESVVDELMAGRAWSCKLILTSAGRLNNRQEDIRQIYESLPDSMRQPFRILNCFLRSYWNHRASGDALINTPSDVIDDIYTKLVKRKLGFNNNWFHRSAVEAMVGHPNTSDYVLLSISQSAPHPVAAKALLIASGRKKDLNN